MCFFSHDNPGNLVINQSVEPIAFMYGIYIYTVPFFFHKIHPNVGKYTIHQICQGLFDVAQLTEKTWNFGKVKAFDVIFTDSTIRFFDSKRKCGSIVFEGYESI